MTNLICYNKAMDKLAYHYNKKKLPAKTEGKYLYYYPCADIQNATIQIGGRGFITIEVTEKEWEALIELDRIEYNNEHKYVRHTVPIPDCEEDNLTAKQQEQLHVKDTPIDTAVAEYWDNKSLHSQLSKEEEKILIMLENGYTQKEIAKALNVTQGYVSMLKIRAQYNYDYIERTSALQTNSPEEYFMERIYPIIVTIRRRRIKQFYCFYSGKKLKKLNYF